MDLTENSGPSIFIYQAFQFPDYADNGLHWELRS